MSLMSDTRITFDMDRNKSQQQEDSPYDKLPQASSASSMELPEPHVVILAVAGVGLILIIIYEIIRNHWSKCRGREIDPEVEKTASCQKLEEPPPSYESLYP